MTDRKYALDMVRNTAAVIAAAIAVFVVAITVSPSYAANDTKAINLVNNGTAAGIAGKQKSNIYFGNYKQSSDGKGGFKVEPVKWRVLQNADGRLFLMSDQLLDTVLFHRQGGSVWSTIDARSWLNGYGDFSGSSFIKEALSEKEQTSIASTLLSNKDDNPKYDIPNGDDTEDKIFILSYTEVIDPDLGFNSDPDAKDSARVGTFTDYAASIPRASDDNLWLLRTKGKDVEYQAAVRGEGYISLGGISVNQTQGGGYPKPIRPALKVDLGQVLFTSSAVNGKQSSGIGPDALTAVDGYTGKDWKVTLKDLDRKFKVTETEASCRLNEKITLHYTGAEGFDSDHAQDEFISAMIVDKAGNVLYYGRVARPLSADGEVEIRIPLTLAKGTYDLKVFSEQFNGDKQTDYASEMSTVSLKVDEPLVPYVNDAGRKQELRECAPFNESKDSLSSGWYAVMQNVNMDKAIIIDGNVNLILLDKVTLKAPYGIKIKAGSKLTIWAQSLGASAGRIVADVTGVQGTENYGSAGITFLSGDTKGKLTINGGQITAVGTTGGAGIGGNFMTAGGDVTINGGRVTVMGSSYVLNKAQAIGYGAQGKVSGDLTLGKVRVTSDGDKYVSSGDRESTCRSKDTEVRIERCSEHIFYNNSTKCQMCGAARPRSIEEAKVTLGDALTYNGEVQAQTVSKVMLQGLDITEYCDISGNEQKNAGKYVLTVTGCEECDFTGSVTKEFTIEKAAPDFTVTAKEVTVENMDISKVVLSRSDTSVPGKLELIEKELKLGTNEYNWEFTPEDTDNYKSVSGKVLITVSDHDYEFTGFKWIGNDEDGYTEAYAEYKCRKEGCGKEAEVKAALVSKVTKPDCENGGMTEYSAEVTAGDSLDDKEHKDSKTAKLTEALGHDWDDGVVTKEPTTAETGEKLFTCSACKATRTETIPVLKPVDPDPDDPKHDDQQPDEREAEEAKEDKTLPVVDIDKADTVGNFKKKQMKIVFQADKKVDNYRIQYRLAGKNAWISDWSAGTGTYIVKNLKKYSLCEFRIAGYVQLDDGTWIRSKWSKISYRYMNSVPLKTVKAGKKKITVTYNKDGKSDGYRIQYAIKKNMDGKKIITVNGRSKTKYTIKGLKKGKTYYIKVRPIKKKSGKIYIGILSGTKKTTVK